MKLLLTAATEFELQPILDYLKQNGKESKTGSFLFDHLEIVVLITGVGITSTTYQLTKTFSKSSFDLAIQAGIAGAFNPNVELGSVFQVVSEQFADLGIEEKDGSFVDLFELELLQTDQAPFIGKKLYNTGAAPFEFLPNASAITVHKVHGSQSSITAIQEKYPVDLESMEGAAFFYVCLLEEIPFLAIRSVSNYVEPRNRAAWEIGLAIERLNIVLQQIVEGLAEIQK